MATKFRQPCLIYSYILRTRISETIRDAPAYRTPNCIMKKQATGGQMNRQTKRQHHRIKLSLLRTGLNDMKLAHWPFHSW